MRKQQGSTKVPLNLFISYAHEDEPLLRQLESHLIPLRRQKLVADWHDRRIIPGDDRAQKIDEHLETASIILLLVSSDFLASDYRYESEMQRALQRHQRSEARVIPIILRPCDWQDAPFARLQALPHDGKAVTKWDNQDEAFQDVARGLRRVITEYTGPDLSPEQPHNRTNLLRTNLLKRVRDRWIDDVLGPSLHQQALIALNLQDQPDALDNPFRFQVQETNRPPRLFPAGTSIVQVYDEADGGLLILGKPGAGKTTLLLELARVLLERAEHDSHQRMPVIFSLSSWAEKCLPLSEWLVEELQIRYWTLPNIGKAWVNTDQILPLLDGLDEVAEPARPNCVQAINTYCEQHQDKGPIPVVVCCRRKDYLALPTHVKLSHAISIRPFTSGQISDYLQSAGSQLEALRQALHTDRKLCVLARYPLMLSIFTLAYQRATRADLPTEGMREATLRQIFGTYVQRMLTHHRQKDLRQGTHKQFKHWLASLASHMQQQQQTEFYIERMQPDWLPDNRSRRVYQIVCGLGVGLLAWLISGLGVGLVIDLSNLSIGLYFGLSGLVDGLYIGLLLGLVFGLLAGLGVGLSREQRIKKLLPAQIFVNSPLVMRYSIRYGLLSGLLSGLFAGLFRGLFVGLPADLFAGRGYQPIFQGGGLLAGLGSGLVFGLVVGLLAGLVVGLLVWLAFGFVGGLLGEQLSEHNLDRPNQGVWLALRNGLFVGLLSGLGFGLGFGLGVGLGFGLLAGLLAGLFTGLLTGLFTGLGVGGNAFIQHFVLRWFLWRARSMPWNLVPFLDEAAERLLLRKVGGGYIFVHRLLLDYFAMLEIPSSEEVSTGSTLLQKSDEKE